MDRSNVLAFALQTALKRAHPSALASNQVLNQFGAPFDTANAIDDVQTTLTPTGYPYGYGELISVHQSSGTWTQSLTEPEGIAWVLRLSSYQQAGSSVALQATVGSGSQQTLTPISPAQASCYADNLFPWSPATMVGEVGLSPFGTPTGWVDTNAWWLGPDAAPTSSDSPGKWLLRNKILVTSTQTYTISLAADDAAILFIDGVQVLASTSSTTIAQVSVSITTGYHLLTIDVTNYETAANPTAVLLSIADPSGNVIEDGSDNAWQTTGFIAHPWSYNTGAPLFEHSWYVINQPTSTSVTTSIAITGAAQVNDLWWYTVPGWRWDKGGLYNATANTALPVANQVTEVVG